jgi:hypothetical protein
VTRTQRTKTGLPRECAAVLGDNEIEAKIQWVTTELMALYEEWVVEEEMEK